MNGIDDQKHLNLVLFQNKQQSHLNRTNYGIFCKFDTAIILEKTRSVYQMLVDSRHESLLFLQMMLHFAQATKCERHERPKTPEFSALCSYTNQNIQLSFCTILIVDNSLTLTTQPNDWQCFFSKSIKPVYQDSMVYFKIFSFAK